ncbi:16S rRNA (cytidine(1402)-2'-O)-methyltransferase [Micrococcoides hystricis]|uniref:Ribosomal RNA small subunit methyltransferase I n=1 Tax=Micrococcoides hystricis TaxID=1572761 RepID=A0ABV6PAA4_9MICC
MSGTITLAATPIGNLSDISSRVLELLQHSPLIAAEDTRRTQQLLNALGVTAAGKLTAYHEHNEAAKTAELLAAVEAGTDLLVVTDAGMPAVSDPGYRLVQAAIAADIPVTCAPGPSAPLVALTLSGLPTDRFCFEGFLPRKAGARAQRLQELADEQRTQVFFEAPHRLSAFLEAVSEAFGSDRQAAVCRELTKKFEQIRRGTLAELIAEQETDPARGEIVIVVAGAEPQTVDLDTLAAQAVEQHRGGERLKTAAAALAKAHGHSTRQIYQTALDLMAEQS